MKKYLLILIILLAGCTQPTPTPKVDQHAYWASYASVLIADVTSRYVVVNVVPTPAPTPTPKPGSELPKAVCDPTSGCCEQKTEQVKPNLTIKIERPILRIFTSIGCTPCAKLKNFILRQPKFDEYYTVEYVQTTGGPVPTSELVWKGRILRRWVGFSTEQEYVDEIQEGLKAQ
jgi:hypothetical protein